MRSKQFVVRISIMVVAFVIFLGYSTTTRSYAFSSPVPDGTQIQEMLRLNAELKSEGYYMGEFEFKLLGIVYYFDKGESNIAFTKLNQLYQQLRSREGLIKIPKFANKAEELEFYLNLQNPRTGAFMDDTYPLFTYIGPTLNMLEHLEFLAAETGKPLRLNHQLKFLDQINNGKALKAFLQDLSTVGGIGAKLPKTPYVAATELIGYREIERNHLYTFSPEWKQALLEWYYENQDSKTGFWGSKLRDSGELISTGELGPSFHIAKLFVDNQGNNLYTEFPLRYKKEMFATTLQKLSQPMPEDLANQHDWSLTRFQGIKMLTNFLWSGASANNKSSARKIMTDIVKNRFDQFYVPAEGAFSLYAKSKEPDLDGTDCALGLLEVVGAFSKEKQERLWGPLDKNIADLGTYEISALQPNHFTMISNFPGVNSIRIYRAEPFDDYNANVAVIGYPRETTVLDVLDLLPRIEKWTLDTPQSMGNWVSRESILKELPAIKPEAAVSVYKGDIPLKLANDILNKNRILVATGVDVLQIPLCKMKFLLIKD